jgi:hypothetical protein
MSIFNTGMHVVLDYFYEGTNSIVLMVFTGPNYEIIWCNVGVIDVFRMEVYGITAG